MADITEISTSIKAFVELQTTDVCIPAEDNGPKPDVPYFTYRLDGFLDEAEDFVSTPDAISGDLTITGNRALTVELQGYGPGVTQKLRDLKTSTRKPSVLAAFLLEGLIVVDRLGITNLTGLDQSEFEERALFEMLMRTDSVVVDANSVIENVNGTGTLKNPPNPDLTIDLEVTTP